ncbi:restriction endonuclease [Mesorhizobium sp. B3-1-3]|uniref:restriction endonuclease n=1 Tax=unclassified Mesorhizobium TaxID=325217 RepID=UPI00112DB2C4|nr:MULTISPECIES: restriction endonuclease [unclassified Mesorhizobium]TPI52678.1 restriction endonuclease [Mesorhizobium sp. B3-1-8]TPI59657.1 restriction endonuclease [Mesorhizobium sp. B3-1-3]
MGVELSRREATNRGFAFEDLVAQLFSKLGYSVTQSARIGRAEIDLLVERDGQRSPVEVSVVRPQSAMMKLRNDAERLRSLLATVEGMSKPIIVLGSELTPAAKAWSEEQLDVSAWDAR